MLRELLKKSQLIDYFYIFARHLTSKESRQKIIDFYRSDSIIRLEKYGEKNPDKFIYMIDASKSYTSGFFSNLSMVLYFCAFAHDRGMHPVIYRNTPSHLNEPEEYRGATQYFSYFFEQPDGITEEEARESSNVIKSMGQHISTYAKMNQQENDTVLVKEIRRSLKFRKDILEELEKSREQFIGNKKVLGVKYRGTGYKWPHMNHPIYVPLEEVVEETKREFDKGYDAIYFATEDRTALDNFKKIFGKSALYDETILRSEEGQLHIDLAISNPAEHTAYKEGLNVLKDVWVLSHTTSFIAAYCGVSYFVKLFNKAYHANKFDLLKIIDKGRYKYGVDSIREGKKMYRSQKIL